MRDDLISGLRTGLKKRFQSRRFDLVTLSVGKQTSRIRPSYALHTPPSPDTPTPAHVGIEGCRARGSEGIRMRCTSRACPFRPVGTGAVTDENAEIAAEDLDEPNFEGCFDAAEADGVAEDDVVMEETVRDVGSGDCKQNLFPYAAPQVLHSRMLQVIGQADTRTHLVILTRTGHPGLIVAARRAGLKVVALLAGVSQQSAAHGQHLLKMHLTAWKMGAAREATPAVHGVKRVAAAELQWQVVTAPAAQPITLRESQPQVSNWRAGINCNPVNLDQKALRQVQAEVETTAAVIAVERRSGLEVATAAKSLREGDVVCSVGGLLFESIEKLMAFFHSNDCSKEFLGNIVKIDGILQGESPSAAQIGLGGNAGSAANAACPQHTTNMFFVLPGIGRFFRHYANLGKQHSNVALVVFFCRRPRRAKQKSGKPRRRRGPSHPCTGEATRVRARRTRSTRQCPSPRCRRAAAADMHATSGAASIANSSPSVSLLSCPHLSDPRSPTIFLSSTHAVRT